MTPLAGAAFDGSLRQDEACFSTLPDSAMCDCDTALGWHARKLGRPVDPPELAAGAGERQWSDTGIEHWLEEKQDSGQDAVGPEGSSRVDDWFELLAELLRSGTTPYIGLLLHEDPAQTGGIRLQGRNESRLSEQGRITLASMDENLLYVFRG